MFRGRGRGFGRGYAPGSYGQRDFSTVTVAPGVTLRGVLNEKSVNNVVSGLSMYGEAVPQVSVVAALSAGHHVAYMIGNSYIVIPLKGSGNFLIGGTSFAYKNGKLQKAPPINVNIGGTTTNLMYSPEYFKKPQLTSMNKPNAKKKKQQKEAAHGGKAQDPKEEKEEDLEK